MNARTEIPLGLFHGLPIDEYHASPGISNSGLSDFAKSPLHYHALHLNPDRPPEETKNGQLEGNLAHCAILEPSRFDERYIIGPGEDRRLKAWKSWEEKLAPEVSAQPIKPSEAAVAFAQSLSVRSNPDVEQLLSVGAAEVSAFWIDEVTGELCRCRPDWVFPIEGRGAILLDVKTCSDASPREFSRQVARKGYHRQAAFYSDGYEIASGEPVLAFVFAAVETTWPFAASAVMLDDESIERGRAENRALLDRFAGCKRTNAWPGYGDGIELVSLPRWATEPIPATNEEGT